MSREYQPRGNSNPTNKGNFTCAVFVEAESELAKKSWGEPHPMKDQGVNEVLCYAPLNREELDIVKLALIESYRYATGRDLNS